MPKYIVVEVPEEAVQTGFDEKDMVGAMLIMAPHRGLKCSVFFDGACVVHTEARELRDVKALKVRRELAPLDVNTMINVSSEAARRFTAYEAAEATVRHQISAQNARQGRSPGGIVVPH